MKLIINQDDVYPFLIGEGSMIIEYSLAAVGVQALRELADRMERGDVPPEKEVESGTVTLSSVGEPDPSQFA